MGTLEQPKADLPADGELVIQNLYIPDDCTQKAVKGNVASVHYTGYLYKNGKKFDSSFDRKVPFSVKLGAGRVIRGWEQGLIGMCPGYRLQACDNSIGRRDASLFLQTWGME